MATKQQPPKRKMNTIVRLTLFWVILAFVALGVVALTSPHDNLKNEPISQVISDANAGKVSKIEVQGNNLTVTLKGQDKPTVKSTKDTSSSIYEQGLKQGKAVVTITPPSETGS